MVGEVRANQGRFSSMEHSFFEMQKDVEKLQEMKKDVEKIREDIEEFTKGQQKILDWINGVQNNNDKEVKDQKN